MKVLIITLGSFYLCLRSKIPHYFALIQTFKWAHDLGGDRLVKLIVEKTHTCYEGTHDELHPWGYGCGKCPSCKLRQKGFEEYLELLKK